MKVKDTAWNIVCDETDLRNYIEKHSQSNKMIPSLNSLGQSSLKGGGSFTYSLKPASPHTLETLNSGLIHCILPSVLEGT